MTEVDFAAHQAMQPVWAYGKVLPEQMDVTGLIATANEDDVAAQRRMPINQDTIDARLRRHAHHFSLQRGSDCAGAIFAQNAFTQIDAQLRNTLFDIGRRTVRGAARLSIGKINAVQALAISALNPERNRALRKPELLACAMYVHASLNPALSIALRRCSTDPF